MDLAIRVGPLENWLKVKAELLLAQRVFPVCAPALAARLKSPRDLAKLPIIHDRPSITRDIFQVRWNMWLALHRMDESMLVTGGPKLFQFSPVP